MTIFNDTFVPFSFPKKEDCYMYVIDRAHRIKRSLRLVESDNEHLTIRCPLSGDFLDVTGTPQELAWLNHKLSINNWWRIT